MAMTKELFMHHLSEDDLHEPFRRESRTPEEIKRMFFVLGFREVPVGICERLSLLADRRGLDKKRNSHFQDAVEIAEIIDNLLDIEKMSEQELNELRFSCLVHDVGKSGPAEATAEEQAAFTRVFNLDFDAEEYEISPGKKAAPAQLPIRKALEIKISEGALRADEADKILSLIGAAVSRQKIKRPQTALTPDSAMTVFWSAHVYWTMDILRDHGVALRVVEVAASHHLLDGHDPAGIGAENADSSIASLELADKYQAFRIRLILADKYQAFRKRTALGHEKTIEILRKIVADKFKSNSTARRVYESVIDALAGNKNLLEKELDLTL